MMDDDVREGVKREEKYIEDWNGKWEWEVS